MICLINYKVIYIDDSYQNLFTDNPFNLKKDLKKLKIKNDRDRLFIAAQIVCEVSKGYGRKQCINLYSCLLYNDPKIYLVLAKIYLININEHKTRLRCILIVDEYNELCIVLHIYEKNNKADLTEIEKIKSKNILIEYLHKIR